MTVRIPPLHVLSLESSIWMREIKIFSVMAQHDLFICLPPQRQKTSCRSDDTHTSFARSGSPSTRVIAYRSPSWASEITSLMPLSPRLTRPLRKPDQNGSRPPRANTEPDDLAATLARYRHSDYRRHRDDAAAVAALEVGRVEPQIRPSAVERAGGRR
jgi:hypothetical protein